MVTGAAERNTTEGTEEHGVRLGDASEGALRNAKDRGKIRINVKGSGRGVRFSTSYSRTLSSDFLRDQSEAAWTKARITGWGFFSVEESWGWNRVARKKR